MVVTSHCPRDQLSTHERMKRGRKEATIVMRLFIILGDTAPS